MNDDHRCIRSRSRKKERKKQDRFNVLGHGYFLGKFRTENINVQWSKTSANPVQNILNIPMVKERIFLYPFLQIAEYSMSIFLV